MKPSAKQLAGGRGSPGEIAADPISRALGWREPERRAVEVAAE
jgi:hypothetical protein